MALSFRGRLLRTATAASAQYYSLIGRRRRQDENYVHESADRQSCRRAERIWDAEWDDEGNGDGLDRHPIESCLEKTNNILVFGDSIGTIVRHRFEMMESSRGLAVVLQGHGLDLESQHLYLKTWTPAHFTAMPTIMMTAGARATATNIYP